MKGNCNDNVWSHCNFIALSLTLVLEKCNCMQLCKARHDRLGLIQLEFPSEISSFIFDLTILPLVHNVIQL